MDEDYYHKIKESFLKVKQDMSKNNEDIKNLQKENYELKQMIFDLNSKIMSLIDNKSTLRKEVIRSFDKNKKSVIKQKILDLVSSKQMTISEIKDVIVEDLKYCSRASFYRYFEELKKRNLISVVSINNVEIVVLPAKSTQY